MSRKSRRKQGGRKKAGRKLTKREMWSIAFFAFLAIVITVVFAKYLSDARKGGVSGCELMRNRVTGEVDCFGCGARVCKDSTLEWEPFNKPSFGIPYSCYVNQEGACALAQ